jgi:hypothetical protein
MRGECVLNGFWTYHVPNTDRGGTLSIRNGVVCGGDNVNFLQGVAKESGDGTVTAVLLATRFARSPEVRSAWGTESARFAMTFEGAGAGPNQLSGRVRRDDLPGVALDMILERRGECP